MKSINAAMSAKEAAVPQIGLGKLPFANYLPAILPLVGAFLMVAARINFGASAAPADFTLIVLAVLCYLTAAASLMTNFWAPIRFLQRLGLVTASLGFFFNFSSWLIRWVARGEAENWKRMTDQITGEYHFWWFFSYIPFANLYDLSVAFAFGAAFATLLVGNRENSRFVGALSFPLVTLILLMAVFIGNTFQPMMPVLDSYWRPIHVGVASMSYGVALVSFALAVVYLIKDGVKSEAVGVAVTAFFIVGYIVVWLMSGVKSFDPFSFSYGLNPVLQGEQSLINIEARVQLPGVGPLHGLSLLALIGMAACFLIYLYKNNEGNNHERTRRIGHLLLRASIVLQVVVIIMVFYHIKTMNNVASSIGSNQFYNIGFNLMGKNGGGQWNAEGQPVETVISVAQNFLMQNGAALSLNMRSNPIEIAALFTMLVASFFVALIGFRSEKLRANLPSLERIDSLIYKTVGVAFAGLAILLVTGAVWANESWGRYWGFDPKETGALVAWLSYAGYLHTRIAHGWSGRRSAYFALLGFLLVIFTYLGVSYILPGLHAYA
jgi:ABC-type transport system involved in cytochrome c biogenesis permease subunit